MVGDFITIIEAIKANGVGPAMIALAVLVLLTGLGFLVTRSIVKTDDKKEKTKWSLNIFKMWRERRLQTAIWRLDNRANLDVMAFKDRLLYLQLCRFLAANAEDTNGAPARAIYFSYHNSGHYVGGDSISKMSLRVQAYSPNSFFGNIEDEAITRNIMRIDFPLLHEKLLHQGHFYISHIQSIRQDDPRFYALLSRASLNSVYAEQIYDDSRQAIGFVLVGYTETPDSEALAIMELQQLAGFLSDISAYTSAQLAKELDYIVGLPDTKTSKV